LTQTERTHRGRRRKRKEDLTLTGLLMEGVTLEKAELPNAVNNKG
jgi:hypothetical protein